MILFKKIVNVFLVVLLLVATTGITLNKHYCMGRLKSVAVFEKANPCIDYGFEEPMPCCEDISEELKVDEITNSTFDFKISPDYHLVAITTYLLINQDLLEPEITESNYSDYSPPPIERDIPILVQSFLI